MATYYARNVTGNWVSTTSWDAASSGGAGPAGPPVAGDTAIFDSGFTGTITVSAPAACAVLTVQAGATGTLNIGQGQSLTINNAAGALTLVSGFNLTASGTGTGLIALGNTVTVASGGIAIPNLTVTGTLTLTISAALAVTGTLILNAQLTTSGAYDITCATVISNATGSWTHTFVADTTLTVSTSMRLMNGSPYALTLKGSSTDPAHPWNLHYNGAAADCTVCRIVFTDVNCAHAIDNWYGGTLTRTTGITNRTSADIGGGTGGVTGRCLQLGFGVA